MRKAHSAVFVAVLICLAAVAVPGIASPAAPKKPSPSKSPAIPVLDGTIQGLKVSPDGKRVALYVAKETADSDSYRIVLFDPQARRIVAQHTVEWLAYNDSYCWSPDSKSLAVADEKRGTLLIGADGKVRELKTREPVSGLAWEGSDALIYHTLKLGKQLHLVAASGGDDEELPFDRAVVGLFAMGGRAWRSGATMEATPLSCSATRAGSRCVSRAPLPPSVVLPPELVLSDGRQGPIL